MVFPRVGKPVVGPFKPVFESNQTCIGLTTQIAFAHVANSHRTLLYQIWTRILRKPRWGRTNTPGGSHYSDSGAPIVPIALIRILKTRVWWE